MTTTYWCELAWLGGEEAEAGVAIEVAGERIRSVAVGVERPPARATRLDGLTLPGFANAHSHAFQRALRGRAQSGRGSFWSWRERMYELAERLDPDTYGALARATYGEMALSGITTVGEFHYLHHGPGGVPYGDPNAVGRVLIEAAAAAGLRITLIDACYLRGGIDAEPAPAQRRFCDRDAAAWAERVEALEEGSEVRVGAAIHSIRAVDPESAAVVAAWASEHRRPLHAHVSEQPVENEASLAAYGRTPTAVLADAGAVTGGFTAVHVTHPEDTDVELLGGAGACCCLCPTTERDLADGIGPGRRLIDAGAAVALGSDSQAVIDPLAEARGLELDERLASGERGRHSAAELLRYATAAGHASIGWEDAGRIEPEARADLVTVGLDGVRLAGTDPGDALDSVVFAASAADVRQVIAGGRVLVSDGAHVELGVAQELHEAIGAVSGAVRGPLSAIRRDSG